MKSFVQTDSHFENPFFVGTVEDNKDPTNNYRVKVRINVLHPDNITVDQLPWAAKVDSSFMGIDSSSILHSVPEVGSKVLVLAIGNDPNSLVYLGCLYKKTDSTPSGDDYLNCYGIYDKNGNYIKLDKIQKLFELIFEGKININKITEMNITVNGNVNLTAPLTNVKGNVNIDGTLNVTKATTLKDTLKVDKTIDADQEITTKLAGGIKLSMHKHPDVFPGPSVTGTSMP